MRPLRLLVISSDTYPPTRVDLSVLFGIELAGRGHTIDLILQSEADCAHSYAASWGAEPHGSARPIRDPRWPAA